MKSNFYGGFNWKQSQTLTENFSFSLVSLLMHSNIICLNMNECLNKLKMSVTNHVLPSAALQQNSTNGQHLQQPHQQQRRCSFRDPSNSTMKKPLRIRNVGTRADSIDTLFYSQKKMVSLPKINLIKLKICNSNRIILIQFAIENIPVKTICGQCKRHSHLIITNINIPFIW